MSPLELQGGFWKRWNYAGIYSRVVINNFGWMDIVNGYRVEYAV